MAATDPIVVYTVTITDAAFSPNPAAMNTSATLRVSVVEEEHWITPEPVWFYSGEAYTAEEVI